MYAKLGGAFAKVWALAIAITVMAGIAAASIPDADGVINGCYRASGGALRVVDPAKGETCKDQTEVPLSWNQMGPIGPPGPEATLPAGTITVP